MSMLCPSARLYCATQQQLDLPVPHYSRPRWNVPQLCPAPQILFSAEELARNRGGSFFSSIGASVPRGGRLHQVWKKNRTIDKGSQGCTRDVLRTFADGFYGKSRLIFTTVIKVVFPIECFILWLPQSMFLFKHSTMLMLHFQFQGCIFI